MRLATIGNALLLLLPTAAIASERGSSDLELHRQLQQFINPEDFSFEFAGISLRHDQAQSDCPAEWISLVSCVVEDCPAIGENCPQLGEQTGLYFWQEATCEAVEQSLCHQFQGADCCLSKCRAEVLEVIKCVDSKASGETELGECQVDCPAVETFEGKMNGFSLSVLPGVVADATMGLDWCPFNWIRMGQCLFQECRNFTETCRPANGFNISNVFPSDIQSLTNFSNIATIFAGFDACGSLGNGICNAFADGGCCLGACAAEIQEVSTCALQSATGLNLECKTLDCMVDNNMGNETSGGGSPDAPLIGFVPNLTQASAGSPFDDLANMLQFGEFGGQEMEQECPTLWFSWVTCAITSCPNFLYVCEVAQADNSAVEASRNAFLEATCEDLTEDICQFVSGEDCCLQNCLAQTQEMTACIHSAKSAVDLTSCVDITTCAIDESTLESAEPGNDACPAISSACMNANNYQECMDLVTTGCADIAIMESCPLQFACNDLTTTSKTAAQGGESKTSLVHSTSDPVLENGQPSGSETGEFSDNPVEAVPWSHLSSGWTVRFERFAAPLLTLTTMFLF